MQNLQLLLHVPDLADFDAQTSASWLLFDRQSNLLREGAGRLTTGDTPRAEYTVIVIPARRIVCIETPLPPVSAKKRDALLRYAIEDKLTIDPSTVHAVVLGPVSAKSNTHVIVAIDRAWFTDVLRWLRDAGIESAQAVSAAALIPVAAGEWGVVLEGAHGLACRPDGFAYSFDIEKRGEKGDAQASSIPLEPPFSLVLALKEACDHQVSPSQLTVFADQSADAPWANAWQQALDCPVRVVALPAVRMVTASAGNLLTGDFAPRSASRGWMMLFKPAIAMAAFIAVLQLGFTVVDAWRLDQRRRAIEAEMTQVFKEVFPKAQAIVDPALQMQRNLDTMKRDAGLGSADDARAALAQLTAIIKSVPNLVPQSVTIGEGSVSAEASVPDSQQQRTLQSRTSDAPNATFAVDASNTARLTIRAPR